MFIKKGNRYVRLFIYVLIAIIVIVGVWFIFAKVLKNKKPKEVTLKDIPMI